MAQVMTDPQIEQLVNGQHSNPHGVLGVHGTTVRALRPDATAMVIELPDGEQTPMRQIHAGGVWEGELRSEEFAKTYKLRADYEGSPSYVYDAPYKGWPTLGDMDVYLFGEGRHRRLWEVLGSHHRCHEGVD